ncbi:hypothetical protein O181_105937 [Austropuccinia psidii MF-1]|uniref:Uncharacterized protein n=1 Tax=Austropuccinia psidii MF-1 TaxID=1389203 RepID=A0A9Q3JR20_9BASI|nr:hypothetical protein [Austropuccinia psidii MF-1]
MSSYLHIKSFLGQEKTIELLGGCSPLYCKEKAKKIKNWLKNQSLLYIDQKKELEMTPALKTEGPVESTSSKTAPEKPKDKPRDLRIIIKVPGTFKARERGRTIGTDLTLKGTGSQKLNLQPWTVSSIFPELLWNSQPRRRKG